MAIRKKTLGIIPARYASTRFPGKPLADIKGMTMIERVYRQAKKSTLLDEVIVATDDYRIQQAVIAFGGKSVMTNANHQSGTDRCLEALTETGGDWEVIINIQGDEPLIHPEQIDQLSACFQNEYVTLATLIKAIETPQELNNPNVVKVVINKFKEALYFSRAAIPHQREKKMSLEKLPVFYKHVGIYGYTIEVLKKITTLDQSELELTEALEQLRWLENGFRIFTALTHYENLSVDVPEDLIEVMNRLV